MHRAHNAAIRDWGGLAASRARGEAKGGGGAQAGISLGRVSVGFGGEWRSALGTFAGRGRGRWGGARRSGAVEGWSLDGGRAVGTQLSQTS
jgi:hypothetical protein